MLLSLCSVALPTRARAGSGATQAPAHGALLGTPEALLQEALVLELAEAFVGARAMDWESLIAMRSVCSTWDGCILGAGAAPKLWARLIRPPNNAALRLGLRGAGESGPSVVDLCPRATARLSWPWRQPLPPILERCDVNDQGLELLHGIPNLSFLDLRNHHDRHLDGEYPITIRGVSLFKLI